MWPKINKIPKLPSNAHLMSHLKSPPPRTEPSHGLQILSPHITASPYLQLLLKTFRFGLWISIIKNHCPGKLSLSDKKTGYCSRSHTGHCTLGTSCLHLWSGDSVIYGKNNSEECNRLRLPVRKVTRYKSTINVCKSPWRPGYKFLLMSTSCRKQECRAENQSFGPIIWCPFCFWYFLISKGINRSNPFELAWCGTVSTCSFDIL